jgi:hypothetical protein
MSTEVFIPYKPHAATVTVVDQANTIIEEYSDQGFTLTLRQLFYQFVARGLLENAFKQYRRLGGIIRDARDGGLIDWVAIEDRTRTVNNHSSWDGPADIIRSAVRSYQTDRWVGQQYRPEVWIEKDALLGVIEGVCTEYRVPYFAHRGNNSQTLQHQAGKRFADYFDQRSSSSRPAPCRPRSQWHRHDARQRRAPCALRAARCRCPSHRAQHGSGPPAQPAAELRQGRRRAHERLQRTLRHR